MDQGVIIKRTKGFYYVETKEGILVECKIKGSLFKDSQYNNQVAVGDKVLFRSSDTDSGLGLITQIEPRTTILARQRTGIHVMQIIASNVDSLFITISLCEPKPKLSFIYQLLAASWLGNITPYIILTKEDLVSNEETVYWMNLFQNIGLPVLSVSNNEKEQVQTSLLPLLHNKTTVFSGMSGVGKSTLLNNLDSALNIRTQKISDKYKQGQHTTTLSVRYCLSESTYVIDTPGVRHFTLYDFPLVELAKSIPALYEFTPYCKHKNCLHMSEPKCGVKEAVSLGKVTQETYDAYSYILQTIEKTE